MDTLSPDGVVEEFLEQWRNSDLRDKMPEPMLVANGPVVELTLIAVYEQHQNKGYATRALEMLTALCDANRVTIQLVARSPGPELERYAPGCPASRSTKQLVGWYERRKFVDTAVPGDDTHTMTRKPRGPG